MLELSNRLTINYLWSVFWDLEDPVAQKVRHNLGLPFEGFRKQTAVSHSISQFLT